MRRTLAALVSTLTILTPSPAFAEFTSPADVVSALLQNTAPTMSKLEMHMHVDDVYVSAWGSGALQGKLTESDGKLRWNMTVDVAYQGLTVRMKFQAVAFQQKVYARLQSIDGAYQDMFGALSGTFAQKKWLMMPLETLLQHLDAPSPEGWDTQELRDTVTSLFALSGTRNPTGWTYTLTPRDEGAMQMIRGATEFTLKVDTDRGDLPQFARLTVRGADQAANMDLTLTAEVQVSPYPVYVDVPKEAMTVEELEDYLRALESMGSATGIFPEFPAAMPVPMPEEQMPTWEEVEESLWESDWEFPLEDAASDDTWSLEEDWGGDTGCTAAVGTVEYIGLMRAGRCPDIGPGRGSQRHR